MKFKQPMLHLANNGKLLTVVFLANLLVCSTLFWWAEGNTWFLSLY